MYAHERLNVSGQKNRSLLHQNVVMRSLLRLLSTVKQLLRGLLRFFFHRTPIPYERYMKNI